MKAILEPLDWWCVDFCFCPTTELDARAACPFSEVIDCDRGLMAIVEERQPQVDAMTAAN